VIDVVNASGAVALRIPCHHNIVCRASAVLCDQDRQTDSVVEGRKRLVMAGDDPNDARRVMAEIYRQCGPGRDQVLVKERAEFTLSIIPGTQPPSTLLEAYRRVYERVYERWGHSRHLRDKYDVKLSYVEVDDLVAAYGRYGGASFVGKEAITRAQADVVSWVAQTIMVQGLPEILSGESLSTKVVAIISDPSAAYVLTQGSRGFQGDLERAAAFTTKVLSAQSAGTKAKATNACNDAVAALQGHAELKRICDRCRHVMEGMNCGCAGYLQPNHNHHALVVPLSAAVNIVNAIDTKVAS